MDWLRFAFEKHLPDLEIWAPISPSYNDNIKMAQRLSLEVQARLLKLGTFPLSSQASGARPPLLREDVSSPPEKEMIKMVIQEHVNLLLPRVCEGPRLSTCGATEEIARGATCIDLESSNLRVAFFPPTGTVLGEQAGGGGHPEIQDNTILSSFKNKF